MEAAIANNVGHVIHMSTACVYGYKPSYLDTQLHRMMPVEFKEDDVFDPISVYGVTKKLGEELIYDIGKLYGIKTTILRLGNIVGDGYSHGVVYDFIKKLQKDKDNLEILGDGSQMKSYLHVCDLTNVVRHFVNNPETNIMNVANKDVLSAKIVADIVCDEMNCSPKYSFTGGKIGWEGDAPYTKLNVCKMLMYGFEPKYLSGDAIRNTIRRLKYDKNE